MAHPALGTKSNVERRVPFDFRLEGHISYRSELGSECDGDFSPTTESASGIHLIGQPKYL
jgi:hypothetical protein